MILNNEVTRLNSEQTWVVVHLFLSSFPYQQTELVIVFWDWDAPTEVCSSFDSLRPFFSFLSFSGPPPAKCCVKQFWTSNSTGVNSNLYFMHTQILYHWPHVWRACRQTPRNWHSHRRQCQPDIVYNWQVWSVTNKETSSQKLGDAIAISNLKL